jgi:threonine/homoserine/homoserine lactone efflux protein
VLVVSGYGLGLFLAAQVGPVTLLIIRSVLRDGRAVAVGLAMALAVAGIDLAYAIVGLSGIGRPLNGGSLRLLLGLVSASILIAIGVRTLWLGLRARFGLESADEVVAPSRAFVTAVAATALNPLTIALWTVSFPAAAPAQATRSTAGAAALLVGVGLGTLSWYARHLDGCRAHQEASWRAPAQARRRRQRYRLDRLRRPARLPHSPQPRLARHAPRFKGHSRTLAQPNERALSSA